MNPVGVVDDGLIPNTLGLPVTVPVVPVPVPVLVPGVADGEVVVEGEVPGVPVVGVVDGVPVLLQEEANRGQQTWHIHSLQIKQSLKNLFDY